MLCFGAEEVGKPKHPHSLLLKGLESILSEEWQQHAGL